MSWGKNSREKARVRGRNTKSKRKYADEQITGSLSRPKGSRLHLAGERLRHRLSLNVLKKEKIKGKQNVARKNRFREDRHPKEKTLLETRARPGTTIALWQVPKKGQKGGLRIRDSGARQVRAVFEPIIEL